MKKRYTIKTRDNDDYAIILYFTVYQRRWWWFDKVIFRYFPHELKKD